MGLWGGRYFILAGAFDPEHKFRLYQWVGPGYAPELLPTLEFSHLNPEALVFSEESSRFLILSDDGTRKVGGVESKSLPDPAQRRFRALWAEFPGHTPADAGGPKGISLSVPGGKQAAERPLPGPP